MQDSSTPRVGGPTSKRDDNDDKLIAGWGVAADTQIVALGLVVLFLILASTFLWPRVFGNDSPLPLGTPLTSESAVAEVIENGTATVVTSAPDDSTVTTEVSPVLETNLSPNVSAAVSTFDGVTGSANGTVAILAGFVGTTAEAQQAETAAALVVGITSVDNRLVVLEEDVVAAAIATNVSDASVLMEGTSATLRGTVSNELEAQTALTAAAAVPGVTPPITNELRILQPEVDEAVTALGTVTNGEFVVESDAEASPIGRVAKLTGEVASEEAKAAAGAAAQAVPGITEVENSLTVVGPTDEDITTDLNVLFELNPIQFGSGSDVILAESTTTLDQAVTILSAADAEVRLEVQGYTDTVGGDGFNLELSERRAAAVRQYLVDAGIPDSTLTSRGLGETTEFGPEFADNRRVRFALL